MNLAFGVEFLRANLRYYSRDSTNPSFIILDKEQNKLFFGKYILNFKTLNLYCNLNS